MAENLFKLTLYWTEFFNNCTVFGCLKHFLQFIFQVSNFSVSETCGSVLLFCFWNAAKWNIIDISTVKVGLKNRRPEPDERV